MSRLSNPDVRVLSELQALRDRRKSLLREADKHRYRLHRLRDLQEEIRQATNDVLQRELLDGEIPEPKPAPLGDAGAVGGHTPSLFPYED